MSFEEFLQSRYVQKQELLQSRLQTLWIKESPQPVQVYKLEDVDLVMTGLLEKFFGEEREPSKLPRKNSSVEEFAWKSMSKLAEGLIRDLYSEDFKNLGYPDHIER